MATAAVRLAARRAQAQPLRKWGFPETMMRFARAWFRGWVQFVAASSQGTNYLAGPTPWK